MADRSKIEWTEATWNPITGCPKVSAGCKNCYAERLALRLQAMGNARYRNGFNVALHPDLIELPAQCPELGGRTYDEMPRQPVIPSRQGQSELAPA